MEVKPAAKGDRAAISADLHHPAVAAGKQPQTVLLNILRWMDAQMQLQSTDHHNETTYKTAPHGYQP